MYVWESAKCMPNSVHKTLTPKQGRGLLCAGDFRAQ